MISRIDHIVILVKDLEAAIGDYGALGFTVTPGGEHADGATHNALISFADGSYLELIAFKRNAPEHRWWRFAQSGEGLIDFALLPGGSAIESINAIRVRGLDYSGPHQGGRKRLDGIEIAWVTGMPPSPDLPFLCADLTPRNLRVPEGPAHLHANRVTGIDSLTIAVKNLNASIQHYQALLGTPPHRGEYQTSAAPVGPAGIILAEAAPDNRLQDYIDLRGEGPYLLTLRTETAPTLPGLLNLILAHGARIELV